MSTGTKTHRDKRGVVTTAHGRATIKLRDDIDSITTTVIGEAPEKFFDCSGEELMHQNTMSNNSSIRRVIFGTQIEPQEKKKQKQQEGMSPDDQLTTSNNQEFDTKSYNFIDATSSASK
ncbi:Uncharacterized protein Fot_27618 [Forsythia ovata]|uniref:Uncharacterized protein n=1 Tax=Forsythia ovata TaxID=205694 RepID=A0ABD1TLN3_9LAMI